jgi:hypothetical protein
MGATKAHRFPVKACEKLIKWSLEAEPESPSETNRR